MEGAYLGAVASTLAAVRRTVDEQGRDKMPPGSAIDAEGDNAWLFEFFRSADSLDMDQLTAHLTDDVKLTFANYPTVHGKQALAAVIGEVWKKIKGMSHSLTGAWSMHGGQVGIAESIVMYTRPDSSMYVVKVCSVLRRRGGKVYDLRIHADTTQL